MPSRKKQEQQPETPPRQCDVEGCPHAGEYKAPKSRNGSREYYFFCLEHVRDFNKCYNYFDGMDDAAVQAFMKDAVTGHRPTWRLGQHPDMSQLELEERLRQFFTDTPKAAKKQVYLPEPIRHALDLLELEHPTDKTAIKRQYKLLVKQYHPDINKSHDATEKFRQITAAYHSLIEHYQSI